MAHPIVAQINRTRKSAAKYEAEKAKLRELLEALQAEANEGVDVPELRVIAEDEPATLTIPEVATRLRVHELTVRRAIGRGELRSVRIGRRVLVPVESFNDWMAGVALYGH